MRQRLALIAVEKNNVARFGLLFAQLQAQAHPCHLSFRLTSLQRVPGPPPAELFFARPWTTAYAHALARFDLGAEAGNRPVAPVGHRFFQQGDDDAQGGFTLHRRRAWRNAGLQRCDTAGGGSLRHRRTVSSRTPNASAILELVQPASVKSTARARSASPRSRKSPRAKRPARCSSLAVTGDFPAMPSTLQINTGRKPQKPIRWLAKRNLLSLKMTCSIAPGARQALCRWGTRRAR